MLKNKFFCFDEKNPVFVKNLEVKLSLCYTSAYVIYEWYLIWGNSRPLTWGSGSGISSGGLSLAFCSFLCSFIDEYPSAGESHRDSEKETGLLCSMLIV